MTTKSSTGPKIDYRDAMKLRLRQEPDGTLGRIADCHASVFRQLCLAAIATADEPLRSRLQQDMAGLQLRWRQDRWWVINMLAEHGLAHKVVWLDYDVGL